MLTHLVRFKISLVCHRQSLSVTYSMCDFRLSVSVTYSLWLSQTVCVCHKQSVSVTDNLCLSQTVCFFVTDIICLSDSCCLSQKIFVRRRMYLSVTDTMCRSKTVCIGPRQSVFVTSSLCLSLKVLCKIFGTFLGQGLNLFWAWVPKSGKYRSLFVVASFYTNSQIIIFMLLCLLQTTLTKVFP